MPEVIDALGKPIEIGDTVVYGVYSRGAALQVGVVEALIPYETDASEPNPFFDPNSPQTYGPSSANPRWRRVKVTAYKVKFREPDETYKDEFGNDRVHKGRTKTLDSPRRFAVVSKAVDTQ